MNIKERSKLASISFNNTQFSVPLHPKVAMPFIILSRIKAWKFLKMTLLRVFSYSKTRLLNNFNITQQTWLDLVAVEIGENKIK